MEREYTNDVNKIKIDRESEDLLNHREMGFRINK